MRLFLVACVVALLAVAPISSRSVRKTDPELAKDDSTEGNGDDETYQDTDEAEQFSVNTPGPAVVAPKGDLSNDPTETDDEFADDPTEVDEVDDIGDEEDGDEEPMWDETDETDEGEENLADGDDTDETDEGESEYLGEEEESASDTSETEEVFVTFEKSLKTILVGNGDAQDPTETGGDSDEVAISDDSSEESTETRDKDDDFKDFKPHISARGQKIDSEDWGYIDVRPGVHMFYWLYRSTHPDGYLNRPWVLWLQGGPGGSSSGYGNFEIIGPLDLNLNPRETTWVKEVNLLFVDNPVGAGYSYVDEIADLTRTTEEITIDLLTLTSVFLEEFPQFETMPFYVFGQSYGGKMGAHFARYLYDEIQAGSITANLKGYAMGNAWISPIDSVETWGPLLYWMGIIDEQGLDDVNDQADECREAVTEGRWQDATNWYRQAQYAVNRHSNYVDFYNILKYRVFGRDASYDPALHGGLEEEFWHLNLKPMEEVDLADLMNGVIREKLGIIPGNVNWGGQSGWVFSFQEGDFMKPVTDILDDSLKNTDLHVIVYQGQLDLICDNEGAMRFVRQLTWDGREEYLRGNRFPLTDPSRQTDTFVKAEGNFKFYWNMRAGHAMPKDDGDGAYRMLQRILADQDR